MIRVGFVLPFNDDQWLGGLNYYRNLINAVQQLPDKRVNPVLIVGTRSNPAVLKEFPGVETIKTRWLDPGTWNYRVRTKWKYYFSNDLFFEWFLKKNDIRVLSHSGYLSKRSKIPTLSWIPDFQHVRMAQFFSNSEVTERNQVYLRICRESSAILLSSYSAQKDLSLFANEYVCKSRILRFVVDPSGSSEEPRIQILKSKYGIDGSYFLLPNQFWVHKNHWVVIQALKILKTENKHVLVVSTGKNHDYRHPEYFKQLMEEIKSAGLNNYFKVLGVVSYPDMIGLMGNSLSVINPSRFEGWSTSVEEAKSLGKRIILSGIPVHLEQDPPGGIYFDPDDPVKLSEIMWQVWSERSPNQDAALEEAALRVLSKRKREFASTYEDIVLEFANA